MRLAVNTFIWTASFGPANFDLLPQIRARGFEGVEVPLFQPSEFAAGPTRRAIESNGLECIICSIVPPGLNLVSEDADVRRQTRAHLKAVVEAAAEAGATLVDGPLYCPVGHLPGRRRTTDEWQWAVEGYQSLTATLDACGVTVAIEPLNRFETSFLNTAADAVALCDAVGHPRVGVAFDTFHANIEEKSIPGACRASGRHLRHVQTSENDRGTPGSGHVDWPGLLAALREVGYEGWLSIESFGPNLGAFSSAVCIWRDIEPSPDVIAWDGIEFLKKRLGA